MMDSNLTCSVIEKDMYNIKLKYKSNGIKLTRVKKTNQVTLEMIKTMGKTRFDIKPQVQVFFEAEDGKQKLLENDSSVKEVLSKPGKFVFIDFIPKKEEVYYHYSAQTINTLVNMLLSNNNNRKLIANEVGMDMHGKHPETEYSGFINHLCSNLDQIKVC